jgi:TPR repeat protein
LWPRRWLLIELGRNDGCAVQRGRRIQSDPHIAQLWYDEAIRRGRAAGTNPEEIVQLSQSIHSFPWADNKIRLNFVTDKPLETFIDGLKKAWNGRNVKPRVMPAHIGAEFQRGLTYYHSTPGFNNNRLCRKHILAAVRAGHVDAKVYNGLMFKERRVPLGTKSMDMEIMIKSLTEAAEQGSSLACKCIGDLFREGYGFARNDELAAVWHQEAERRKPNV